MNSKLSLSTKLSSNGKTQLAEYFATPPFKVMTLPNYSAHWENGLNAMQMSSSPGVLAGDVLEIDISLAKSTALSLNTQAFTRVQAMNEGESAMQTTHISLAENSRLFYLPHPLDEQSELIYGEIVAIGRVLNDERFAFRQFSSHLKIYALQNDGKKRPLVSDCIQWLPSKMNLTALSQMENYSHQGALTYLNLAKSNAEIKQQVQALQQQFADEKDLLLGISLLNESGLMVRVLGHRAETIQQLFEKIGEQLKSIAFLSQI